MQPSFNRRRCNSAPSSQPPGNKIQNSNQIKSRIELGDLGLNNFQLDSQGEKERTKGRNEAEINNFDDRDGLHSHNSPRLLSKLKPIIPKSLRPPHPHSSISDPTPISISSSLSTPPLIPIDLPFKAQRILGLSVRDSDDIQSWKVIAKEENQEKKGFEDLKRSIVKVFKKSGKNKGSKSRDREFSYGSESSRAGTIQSSPLSGSTQTTPHSTPGRINRKAPLPIMDLTSTNFPISSYTFPPSIDSRTSDKLERDKFETPNTSPDRSNNKRKSFDPSGELEESPTNRSRKGSLDINQLQQINLQHRSRAASLSLDFISLSSRQSSISLAVSIDSSTSSISNNFEVERTRNISEAESILTSNLYVPSWVERDIRIESYQITPEMPSSRFSDTTTNTDSPASTLEEFTASYFETDSGEREELKAYERSNEHLLDVERLANEDGKPD